MFDPKPVQIDLAGFRYYVAAIVKRYRLAAQLIVALLFAGLSLLYYVISVPKYQAFCSFVLEEKSSSAGLAGLASQFGIDVGSVAGGGGSFFSGENIAEIIRSSAVLQEALLTRDDDSVLLADRYLKVSGLPQKYAWQARLSNFRFDDRINSVDYAATYDTTMLVIIDRIRNKELEVDRINKKGSIYRLSFTSADPVLASLLAERLVAITAKLYVDIKTRTLTANIAQLETKADSLRQLFSGKVRQTYAYQLLDANQAYVGRRAAAEATMGDKSILFGLYSEVMKNVELSRMMLVSQTPVIQVLDRPQRPLVESRLALSYLLLMAITLSIAAYIFYLVLKTPFSTPLP